MKKTLCFVATTFMVLVGLSAEAQLSNKPLNTLAINRMKIDSLDNKIIEAIGMREKLVTEIGLYKAKNHIPPLQVSRFQDVLKKSVDAGKQQNLSENFVVELMNAIHKESLRIENEIKDKHD